jgi:pimeloyl-ACP methyl ester carboxylesterase
MTYSVTEVPNLAPEFTDRFESRYVQVNDVTVHAVIGGDGPPLLLLPGWPQFWYEWRLVMPRLADRFTVVAPDPRGSGDSTKAESGYDAATMASDMAALMSELGHSTYAVVGHDVGMIVGYVLAADQPDRVTRLAVAEAILPGISPSPPLMMDPALNEFLWHFSFNRLAEINERMVSGREEIYFGHQFASKTASPVAIPAAAVVVYVSVLRDPAALRASFEVYRNTDTAPQVVTRANSGPLEMPVLAIGGEFSMGADVEQTMKVVAKDVAGVVIPGCAHFVPEEAPDALAKHLLQFLQS